MSNDPKDSRINREPAFILTSAPWRESSLRLEVFSRHYGRVAIVARGARRRQSEWHGLLEPFLPVNLSWFGQNELRTLHRAEWLGGWGAPRGVHLMSAFYVNELMLKMTAREDPQESLYDALVEVMRRLSSGERAAEALRLFEWRLLRACGFAPDTARDDARRPLCAETIYLMQAESSPRRADAGVEGGIPVHGMTLQSLAAGRLENDLCLREALSLNRMLLAFRLHGDGLCARRSFIQLNEMKGKNDVIGSEY